MSALAWQQLTVRAAENPCTLPAAFFEGAIMRVGGWRTGRVFERYVIVSQTGIADALKNFEAS